MEKHRSRRFFEYLKDGVTPTRHDYLHLTQDEMHKVMSTLSVDELLTVQPIPGTAFQVLPRPANEDARIFNFFKYDMDWMWQVRQAIT